jgi:hypothetical protein
MNRASAGSSVRVERIDQVMSYSTAFDYLTKFYKARPRPRKTTEFDEIDLTGEDDDMEGIMNEPTQSGTREEAVDAIDLAAGVPGKFHFCRCR